MKNKVVVLTYDIKINKKITIPLNRVNDFSARQVSRETIMNSDLIVFVQDGFPIKVLKDRTGEYQQNETFYKLEFIKLGIKDTSKVKSICKKQSRYLFDLLHDSKKIELTDWELKLIIYTLVRGWYETKYSDSLNIIRKSYSKIFIQGTLA